MNKRIFLQSIFSLTLIGFKLHAVEIASIYDLMKCHSEIKYYKCHDQSSFEYSKPFPISTDLKLQPNKGVFGETFLLSIPNGRVCSDQAYILIDNYAVKELMSQYFSLSVHYDYVNKLLNRASICKKISGKVLVLERKDSPTYAHWFLENIARIALVQMHNIEYDWIYLDDSQPFQKNMLSLLGVDSNKIIHPHNDNFYIQADELIVPSLTARRVAAPDDKDFIDYFPLSIACPLWVINFLRESFIPLAEKTVDDTKFSKKVFISRKKARFRRILNEDEIFALFEAEGFKRYCLEDLPFLEQVALFKGATHIVGPHGAGFSGILFCNQGARTLEIYQERGDSTFWYLAQVVGVEPHCIKTSDNLGDTGLRGAMKDTVVPVLLVKNYMEKFLQD